LFWNRHKKRYSTVIAAPLILGFIGLVLGKLVKSSLNPNDFTKSDMRKAETMIFALFFLLGFADSSVLFGEHLALDIEDGTRVQSNLIGMKSLSYWAGIFAADYLIGLVPILGFVVAGMIGVVIPNIFYWWVPAFSGFFFLFQYIGMLYLCL
jgi:hypothetical protein